MSKSGKCKKCVQKGLKKEPLSKETKFKEE